MKHLVYCILSDAELPRNDPPAGMDGGSVSFLREGGLAAAFSLVDEAGGEPDVVRAREYAAVIDALNRTCTVLPMRYGCLLPSRERVGALLRERREEFLSLLSDVRGCVEMVLHVRLEEAEGATPELEPRAASSRPSGAAHLSALAKRYAYLDAVTRAAETVAEECRLVFGGLFTKWKTDYSPRANRPGQTAAFRIFFLVKREDREAFVDAYKKLALHGSAFLSGPWPPHNFVCLDAGERTGQLGGGGSHEIVESVP